MARTLEWVRRPGPNSDVRARSGYPRVGIFLGLVGMLAVAVASIGNFGAAAGTADPTRTLAWTFGVTTGGFGTIKLGIAVVLVGIIVRLWLRVDSVKAALARLASRARATETYGELKTAYGRATVTPDVPRPLFIHRMARALWLPMLVMGVMAVAIGFVLSLFTAGQAEGTTSFLQLSAWTQGVMFLGEALLLSGISFLLGTILAGLREGGGEVQHSLGVAVKTLKMPGSAKLFVVLMAIGMMAGIAQFVLYIVAAGAASDAGAFAVWATWLGPLREAALGILLSGIVLALFTISKVLGFQFTRIRELIVAGS